MEIRKLFLESIYQLSILTARITANTTCWGHFYQNKLDDQLNQLKKYHEK